MKNSLLRLGALGLLGLLCSGCVSRGFPTHGGGKRFSREQQLVSVSIDLAVDEMDLDQIPAEEREGLEAGVGLLIFSVADSGGGIRSGGNGGFSLLGALGIGGSVGNDAAGGVAATVSTPGPTDYASYGFSSSRDVDYLKGRIVHKLLDSGLRFNPNDYRASLADGMIVVTVGELGIDESSFNALVVSSNRLKARVQLNAYYVRQSDGDKSEPLVIPLYDVEAEGTTFEGRYEEWYIFGIGPVNETSPRFDDVDRDE